jgi:AraC-like DNA-binding protein
MKASFEKISPGASSFLGFERRDLAFPYYWHYHPEFELTLIVESHGQRLVGDGIEEYGPGDLVLLGPNLPHSWRSTPAESGSAIHRAVVAQFREDFLGEKFFQTPDLSSVACLLCNAAGGLAFGHTETGFRIAKYLRDLPSLSPGQQLTTLLSALVDLSEEKQFRTLSSATFRPLCRLADQRRVDAVCRYLDTHFQEDVDFARLSANFNMDQASLCRFFKRATGRTMTEYINELRVGAAAQLLIDTDESVLDICFQVGFGNYSHFNRQFKRIKGVAPRSLRREFASDVGSIASPGSHIRSEQLQNLNMAEASEICEF